ncbi:MAG: TRAP transporter small permease [Nitrospinota bacterium]
MKILKGIDDILARIETVLLISLLTFMISLAFLEVILRNFFSYGIVWGDIFLRYLVIWIALLGASLATREGRHINIDIISRYLSWRWKTLTEVVVNIVSATVCIFLSVAAWKFITDEWQSGGILFHNIPAWIMEIILPSAFILITFRFIIRAIEGIIALSKGNSS